MAEKKASKKETKAKAQAEENLNENRVPVETSEVEEQEPVKSSASASELIKNAEKADVELSDKEKSALKAATGEATGKKYKLADPNTQYSEEGFTLAGDQEKELPENPTDALIARIRSGFITEA